MGLFGRNKYSGIADVIRCDEPSYLIWKWHPAGSQLGEAKRENSIRWGSSLRVKEGELAVFVYSQEDGTKQDFIEGPFDQKLETKNLPVLSGLLGVAFHGDTPFQAEIYFINLAKIVQVNFAVPYFNVYDYRFTDMSVPVAVRGTISFSIIDYRAFIKQHRLINFNLVDLEERIRSMVARYVKNVVTNISSERNIPVVQIERLIVPITEIIEADLRERLRDDFVLNLIAVDINAIDIDEDSDNYRKLSSVTQEVTSKMTQAQLNASTKNIEDMQKINADHINNSLRIQREEAQYDQHKKTQTDYMEAFQLEKQAEVAIAGAESIGGTQTILSGESSGNGFNPISLMTGISMGSVIGQNIAGMMGSAFQDVNSQKINEPQQFSQKNTDSNSIHEAGYYIIVNGKTIGPISENVLNQMISSGITIEKIWFGTKEQG